MVEISTIFYKRYIDSCGVSYDKVMNFCKSKKWGDDFGETEYADIINEFQDAIIWILRKAKYYESIDVHYNERLEDENYRYNKTDIEKSKIKVFKDFDRKELCDYFMYYVIDERAEKEEKGEDNDGISYMELQRADSDIINVINEIINGLRYGVAEYFYNSSKKEGWIDSRVKGKVYNILQIEENDEEKEGKTKNKMRGSFSDRLFSWMNKDRFDKLRFT